MLINYLYENIIFTILGFSAINIFILYIAYLNDKKEGKVVAINLLSKFIIYLVIFYSVLITIYSLIYVIIEKD